MKGKLKFFPIVVLSSVTAICGDSYSAEDRSFDINSMTVRAKADQVLIDGGYCINSNDCRKKKHIFLNPRSDGFDVYVYDVNDKVIINKIVIACLEERLLAKLNFSIRVYSVTKDDELSSSMWNKPSYSEFTYRDNTK